MFLGMFTGANSDNGTDHGSINPLTIGATILIASRSRFYRKYNANTITCPYLDKKGLFSMESACNILKQFLSLQVLNLRNQRDDFSLSNITLDSFKTNKKEDPLQIREEWKASFGTYE